MYKIFLALPGLKSVSIWNAGPLSKPERPQWLVHPQGGGHFLTTTLWSHPLNRILIIVIWRFPYIEAWAFKCNSPNESMLKVGRKYKFIKQIRKQGLYISQLSHVFASVYLKVTLIPAPFQFLSLHWNILKLGSSQDLNNPYRALIYDGRLEVMDKKMELIPCFKREST